MKSLIDVVVPDIGDFKDVEVIEVLVKPGDTIQPEQSLITVESDKASMEIPSSRRRRREGAEGQARRQGLPGQRDPRARGIGRQRNAARGRSARPPRPPKVATRPQRRARARPAAAAPAGKADVECDVLVLGAGPGGYSAAFRAADLGQKVVLVERYATLGGVCLNVGCIPSKALLHVAAVMDEAAHFADLGVAFGAPKLDLGKLRAHKDKVVGKLTGGLAAMAKLRKVTVVRGLGSFVGPNHLEVELTEGDSQQKSGQKQLVRFASAIIAAGSAAVRLPFLPDDPRIVDSTGALELRQRAEAHAGHRRRHHRTRNGDGLLDARSACRCRRDARRADDGYRPRPRQGLAEVQRQPLRQGDAEDEDGRGRGHEGGTKVRFEGEAAPAEPQAYDLILQSVGRSPNGRKIGADAPG